MKSPRQRIRGLHERNTNQDLRKGSGQVFETNELDFDQLVGGERRAVVRAVERLPQYNQVLIEINGDAFELLAVVFVSFAFEGCGVEVHMMFQLLLIASPTLMTSSTKFW